MKDHFGKRLLAMAIGSEILAMGVTCSMKAQIGASPQGCCPAVFSEPLGLSVGTVTWILYMIFLLIQVWALGREFSPWALLQLPFSFIYGRMLDWTLWLCRIFPEEGWFCHILYCLLGIFFLSIGVVIMLKADLLMLPPDAMMAAVARRFGKDYSQIKLIADATMVVIALTGSLLYYHRLVQVGIGTIFAALMLGRVIRWFKNRKKLDALLNKLILT